jgi:hypothetical protein
VDDDLRQHIERHAEDASRHAQMLRDRAEVSRSTQSGASPDRVHDGLDQATPDTSHGVRGSSCDELGEVAFVAMLHVAEQRARGILELYADVTHDDAESHAVFEAILEDANRHVAYTGSFLQTWREHGQETAVRRGLQQARRSRTATHWRGLGLASGAGLSRFILRFMYWTVLVPFGLLSRPPRRRAPSQPPRHTRLHSQY